MANSIDIVVPSFRLDEKYLIPILALNKPKEFDVNFYIVADDPRINIPQSILDLSQRTDITLISNQKNLGFSATRNKGIDAGSGNWVLLLDDDITPNNDLLYAYAKAISTHPDALGFVGVTNFPPVINSVTKALQMNGVSTHFQLALHQKELYWSATANVILNRKLLADRRFSTKLTKSTEDMELLFRNAYENDLKKYIAVPQAVVTHPWWGNGRVQTKRMFNYGAGAGEAAQLLPIKLYTHYDLTNTAETILLIIIAALFFAVFKLPLKWLMIAFLAQLAAEYFTNYYKAFKIGKTLSPMVVLQMMWHKNVMEAGRLYTVLRCGQLSYFGRRIDGSFRKQHPQAFRLNRWKIIKLSLFVIIMLILGYYTSL